jgi:hypothetical protein
MAQTKEFYMHDTSSGYVFVTQNPENWKDCEQISKTEGKRMRAENAKQVLLNILKEGDTIYTVLRHVSASGMSRRIDLYTFKDNKPVYLTGHYAMMQGEDPPKDGYKVGGCGMDMGFHLVYTLSSLLYKKDRGGYELRHEWI